MCILGIMRTFLNVCFLVLVVRPLLQFALVCVAEVGEVFANVEVFHDVRLELDVNVREASVDCEYWSSQERCERKIRI